MIAELFGIQKRSFENPAIPLTSANILSYLGGQSTSAGIAINRKNLMTSAAMWQGIKMISETVADLPLEVFKRTPELGPRARMVDKEHHSYRFVAREANQRMHSCKFWRRLMVHALIYERAFAYIERDDNGQMLGMYHLLPDRTTYNITDDLYYSEINGVLVPFFRSQVYELEGMAFDDSEDFQLIRNCRNSIALGLAAEEFSSKFFVNGAKAGGYLEVPAHFTKTAADTLVEGFYRTHENRDSWFKTVILRDGAKFHQATIDAQKSQLHELRDDQVKEVARWLNLSPSRLGIEDGQSYNSKSEDNRDYYDTTIKPWTKAIAAECYLKLLSESEKALDTHYFEHNTADLLSMDRKAVAEIGNIELMNGSQTWNEYRAATNRNPVAGGDFRMVPLNMAIVGEDGQKIGESTPDPVETGQENRSLSALIESIEKEVNRKTQQRFVNWIDHQRNKEHAGLLLLIKQRFETFTGDDLPGEVKRICKLYQDEVTNEN